MKVATLQFKEGKISRTAFFVNLKVSLINLCVQLITKENL